MTPQDSLLERVKSEWEEAAHATVSIDNLAAYVSQAHVASPGGSNSCSGLAYAIFLLVHRASHRN